MPTPTIRTSTSSSRGSSSSSASIENGSDLAAATAALICMGILPVRDGDLPATLSATRPDRQCPRGAAAAVAQPTSIAGPAEFVGLSITE
jgi:hypothetical protein